MSLPKHNHILRTTTTTNKQTSKQTNKQPKKIRNWKMKNPRSHHEIPKSKIGERERERETEESKKQKRQCIEREYLRHGGLRLLESEYLHDSGLWFCFSTRIQLLESEWVSLRGRSERVFVFLCLNFEDFVMSRLKVLWFCVLGNGV